MDQFGYFSYDVKIQWSGDPVFCAAKLSGSSISALNEGGIVMLGKEQKDTQLSATSFTLAYRDMKGHFVDIALAAHPPCSQ